MTLKFEGFKDVFDLIFFSGGHQFINKKETVSNHMWKKVIIPGLPKQTLLNLNWSDYSCRGCCRWEAQSPAASLRHDVLQS